MDPPRMGPKWAPPVHEVMGEPPPIPEVSEEMLEGLRRAQEAREPV